MRADKFVKACIAAVTLAAPFAAAQGLRYEPPQIDGYEYPFPSSYGSPLAGSSPAILKNNGKLFSDTADIDFEGRRLTFLRTDSLGHSVWTYHYGELNDYITDSRNHSFYEQWYNGLSARERNDLGMPAPPKLQWELAVHYPPWAQRLLGNDPPRLKIEGRLQLTVAFDYVSTKIGEDDPVVDIIPFDFDPQYQFAIRGSVGRLISVNITHSKQDGFELGEDPLKNFKVEYKESEPGELEDEIIQEIVAGYTGFDMPGTSLSGYSDKHDGLFGIKVRAKVGPLMLTGIASHAQGEAVTREFGGKNDPNSTSSIKEDEFAKNTYFFLDTRYKEYYNALNNIKSPNRNRPADLPGIRRFQAFVSIRCEETTQSTTRRYRALVDGSVVCFKMLEENKDYIYDADRGWVRFGTYISDDDIVAIAMKTSDGSLDKGDTVALNTPNDSYLDSLGIKLWTLKPRGMEQATAFGSDSLAMRFGLMWRNVYYLPEIEDGKLELFFLDPAKGDTIRHNSGSRLFSEVMGLTDAQGRARLEMVDIYNVDRQELIIPPYDAGLNGNEPFRNPLLGKYSVDSMAVNDSTIYTVGTRHTWMANNFDSKFGILTNGTARRTSYDNLGWNILPGTVTIKTKSGTLLVEDEDYILDYQMGILELISTRARAAESILATYQRESDFVLERKVFTGLRGEVKLPFISDNSFAAAGILYQNAATSADDIPQIGNEPFSKLHLSFNTSLDFEPEWMTGLVNKIPLVKTEEESAAKIDFEVVHSRMNQNTAKEKGAYLEDFERTKDSYSLSLRHQSWYSSHFPFKYSFVKDHYKDSTLKNIDEKMREQPPVWDFYWFTPNAYDDRNLINRYSVWTRDPHNPSYSSSDSYIDVLRLHAKPAPEQWDRALQGRLKNSYASITSSFGRSGLNMENHRYIELIVNPRGVPETQGLRKGKLMIQIGTFSHDQVRDGGPPNGEFDLEDPTYQNKPELLSTYDKGLNRLDAADKYYMIPKAACDEDGCWDTLKRTDQLLVFPKGPDNPNGDLFRRYDRDNTGNFRWANGTRSNSLYDTENIDFDGIPRVQFEEKYISYTIDFDDAKSSYIQDGRLKEENGWRFYRIPLPLLDSLLYGAVWDTALGGKPEWAKVRGVRLVWYDFDTSAITSENQLHIAGLELTGSTWEPAPGSEGKIEPTMISNDDNLDYYNSVYGGIVRRKTSEATPKEGALRLLFSKAAGRDTVLVRKNMRNYPQNISGYDSLSIMVNNVDLTNGEDFVLRFGSDDSTYYEYRAPLRAPGARGTTGSWERFVFSLQKLSDLKLNADVSDTARINESGGRLRVVAPSGKRPNFTAITFLAVGVATGADGIDSGQIWVNELMAAGPRSLTGMAARIDLSTQWADFLSLGAGASYMDGNFRTMTENLLGTDDRSELSANVSGKMRVDKFMPDEWGVSVPVGGSLSGTLSRPTVKPQSDIMLMNDNGKPDDLFDMAGDALDLMLGREGGGDTTRAEQFQTFATTRNAYTSFEKTSESENPFVGFTLDRMKTDVSYNRTTSYTGKGPHEDPDSADYFRSDTVTTYASNLYYDLSPRNPPEWTSVSPLSDVEWMPGIYQKYKFNVLPSSIEFDIYEAAHRTEKRNDAKLNVHDFTTRTFDMRHGARVEYTPIDPLLNFDYGIRWDRDLSDQEMTRDWDILIDSTFPKIFGLNHTYGQKWNEYGVLYGERGRTQSASMRLTPQFVTWMTHSADYTADYQGQLVRRDTSAAQYINAIVNTSLRLRSSLLLMDFFKGLSNGSKDGFFGIMNEGVTKIGMRSINVEYDVNTSLKNNYLSSTFLIDTAGLSHYEYFKYQLGLRRDGLSDYFWGRLGSGGLGYMRYRQRLLGYDDFELYRYDQSMGSWNTRFSTAFTIPVPVKINFSTVSVGWGREFYAQPDTQYIDTTIVLPDVRAGANTDALEKIPLIQTHLSKLGLSSSFAYKRSRKEALDRTDTTTNIDLQPLVGLDGRFRNWPTLTANYRYGLSATHIVNGGKGESVGVLSKEDNLRNSHTLTAAYEFTGAGSIQEIKFRRWVIPVSGKTTVGMAVNWETSVRVYTITGDEPKETEDSEFNYSPYIDYKFTDNISGQARYLGSHRNSSGARTMQQRFAITAEVVF